MAVPRQVIKASKDADRIASKLGLMNAPPLAPEDAGPETLVVMDGAGANHELAQVISMFEPEPAPAKSAPAPAAPAATIATPEPSSVPAASASASPPVSASPPAAAEKTEPAPAADETLRRQYEELLHKHKTLQGKYQAEVPVLAKKLHESEARVGELTDVLASVKPGSAPLVDKELLTDEEISDYGQDMLSFVQRAALAAVRPELRKVMSSVQNDVASVRGTIDTNNRVEFFRLLDQGAPGWRETNVDKNFLAWLEEADPMSGFKRGLLLTQAFNDYDVGRTVVIFRMFQQASNAGAAQTPAPAPVPAVHISELVAPGVARASSDVSVHNQGGKRIWTQAEIASHYDQVRKGAFRGKEAEHHAIELEIVAAAREGRVR